jgi:hypothetical protein
MIPECRPFALELEPVLAGRILQVHYRRHINLVTPTTPKLSERETGAGQVRAEERDQDDRGEVSWLHNRPPAGGLGRKILPDPPHTSVGVSVLCGS